VVFAGACLVFSRYVEKHITNYFKCLDIQPDLMIVIVGMGFIIAAAAELMGFSVAIGAFFAGLVFSRDPAAVKNESSFIPLYEFFAPFFFIGMGLALKPEAMAGALGLGAVFFGAAVVSKLVGAGVPTLFLTGRQTGTLVGVSMVPRAEILLVVSSHALTQGAVSHTVFGSMVVVSALTCTVGPIAVRILLKKWPSGTDP
jgi:Kef-type K+ transport system membrane component KefB